MHAVLYANNFTAVVQSKPEIALVTQDNAAYDYLQTTSLSRIKMQSNIAYEDIKKIRTM